MSKEQRSEIYAAGGQLMDEKDFAILRLLQDNAKMTIRELADAIHLSTTPVYERIRKMESSGVIEKYTTLINRRMIGKGLLVLCYISLRQHSKKEGAKFIALIEQMDEVIECYSISGEFDFMLKVAVKDMNSYYDFHVNKLGQAENIGHLQSIFVMGVIKESSVRP